MPRPHTTLAGIYLALQAALVAAWWLMLWLAPNTRTLFLPTPDWPTATLLAFALPDLTVLVLGSAAAAVGLQRHTPWARPLLWFVAGAVAYATLWCLGANLATGGGWLATALMLGSSLGTGWTLWATKP